MFSNTMLAIEQQSPAVKQIKPFFLNWKKRLFTKFNILKNA